MKDKDNKKDYWMNYEEYIANQKFKKEKESLVYPQWLKIFCSDDKDMKK